jgi:hypothetical protein
MADVSRHLLRTMIVDHREATGLDAKFRRQRTDTQMVSGLPTP